MTLFDIRVWSALLAVPLAVILGFIASRVMFGTVAGVEIAPQFIAAGARASVKRPRDVEAVPALQVRVGRGSDDESRVTAYLVP